MLFNIKLETSFSLGKYCLITSAYISKVYRFSFSLEKKLIVYLYLEFVYYLEMGIFQLSYLVDDIWSLDVKYFCVLFNARGQTNHTVCSQSKFIYTFIKELLAKRYRNEHKNREQS